MKVVLMMFYLMFLIGCSETATTQVGTITPTVQQVKLLEKSKNWLPTHSITSQDFVFKNGKVCAINSLADAYCATQNTNFTFKTDSKVSSLPSKIFNPPITLDRENLKRRLNYLMDIEDDTSIEYSLGRHALTVTAKHKF